MAEDIDDGKSVQLGEFGIFSPTIRTKSSDEEKEISSKSIVQRKILFYPGKIFKDTLADMSITQSRRRLKQIIRTEVATVAIPAESRVLAMMAREKEE